MSVRAKELGWLLSQVVADLPETREEAAAVTVDWEPALSDFQKRLLVRTLALVASVEASDRIRETQPNAISELFRPPLTTKGDVAPLFEIPAEVLDDQDRDYLDGLLEALAEFPRGVDGPA